MGLSHLPSPVADFPQEHCFRITERRQSLLPCPQCLLRSTMFSKPPGLWWWLAMSHLFLEARAQGPSQGLNCFLVPKSLLIFFFYSFSNNGRVFGTRHTSWLVPLLLSGLLSCVLIFDSWKTSHLDFLTPPQISESVQNPFFHTGDFNLPVYLFNPLSSPSHLLHSFSFLLLSGSAGDG